ncbi:MAG: methyltransferase domain-containing protein [Thermoanaerobaculia bacterium]
MTDPVHGIDCRAGRFSGRVADYIKARPGYPPALLTFLSDRGALFPGAVVADAGSGTGLFTELLPPPASGSTPSSRTPRCAAAEARLGERQEFHSVDGRAEATGLPERSVDLVVAAQAFHWFDPPATRAEWRRILRPAAPPWSGTHDARPAPFLERYEQLLLDFGTDYGSVGHRGVSASGWPTSSAPRRRLSASRTCSGSTARASAPASSRRRTSRPRGPIATARCWRRSTTCSTCHGGRGRDRDDLRHGAVPRRAQGCGRRRRAPDTGGPMKPPDGSSTGIRGIAQLAYTVSDLPRAVTFYRDVLGLRFLRGAAGARLLRLRRRPADALGDSRRGVEEPPDRLLQGPRHPRGGRVAAPERRADPLGGARRDPSRFDGSLGSPSPRIPTDIRSA